MARETQGSATDDNNAFFDRAAASLGPRESKNVSMMVVRWWEQVQKGKVNLAPSRVPVWSPTTVLTAPSDA